MYGVLSDSTGAIWLSTNRGLSRFSPGLGTFQNYDQSDGLQGEDFNTPWPVDGGAGGTEDRCVVLKLYGLTDVGGVVVIDVRKSDVLRDHPSRN